MANILKDLGYNDIRTLAKLEGAEYLEDPASTSYAQVATWLFSPGS